MHTIRKIPKMYDVHCSTFFAWIPYGFRNDTVRVSVWLEWVTVTEKLTHGGWEDHTIVMHGQQKPQQQTGDTT